MKIAVSIPDEVFEDAEDLAHRLQTSRSALYARALRDFVARHDVDRVTECMDATLAEVGPVDTEFSMRAARDTLAASEW